MNAVLERSRTSTSVATLVGVAVGLAVVGVYLATGLFVADWRIDEFLAHLSASNLGYFVGMILLTIAVFGLPIVGFLRYDLTTPLLVLGVVVLGWLVLGSIQGLLTLQTIFGLALYAAMLSPIYLVLYGVFGGGEYLLRTKARHP